MLGLRWRLYCFYSAEHRLLGAEAVPHRAFLNVYVLMHVLIVLLAVLSAKVNVSIKTISVSLTFKAPSTFLGPCVIKKC